MIMGQSKAARSQIRVPLVIWLGLFHMVRQSGAVIRPAAK
jgi:hypothetical protein